MNKIKEEIVSAKTDKPKSRYISRVVSSVKDNHVVAVEVSRNGRFTIAQAYTFLPANNTGGLVEYHSTGATIKYEHDKEASSIGERLSIGRALRKLGTEIIADTMEDVHQRCETKSGNPFHRYTLDDLVYIKELAIVEIKERKSVLAKKEAKRKKYVAEAETKKAIDEIEKAGIMLDTVNTAFKLTQGEDA
jgi:hypothetical protein